MRDRFNDDSMATRQKREEKLRPERDGGNDEETEYKIHMTAPVILNANGGCVFARVTHCFFH